MTPKLPRPQSYAKFDQDFAKAAHDTLPPAAKRALSERDIKTDSDTMAMARAITLSQTAADTRHAQLVAQVAALHAHLITFHAWATRNPILSNPWTRLATTFLGAAAGAYAATKGLK